jgi:hypothetical protein
MFALAQRGAEVGFNAGVAYYFGDLNTQFNLSRPGLGLNAYGRFNFDERIAIKMGLYYGRISGDDAQSDNAFQQARNLDFYSNVWDGTLQLEFNFFPYIHGSKDRYFTPYIFAGLSAFHYNPKTKLNGTTYSLREFGTEGQDIGGEYSLFNLGVAYGGGLKWDLNYYWSINVELSGRFLFTDYLDDVSEVYPDPNVLAILRGPDAVALSDRSDPDAPGGQIGRAGIQRGNSKNNDSYNFAMVGLAYYFGRVKCPPISRPNVRSRKKSKY